MEEPGVARRGSRRLLLVAVAAWLVTRALVVWLFLDSQSWVTGDADYFASSLSAVHEVGLARTLVEYPLPGVAVVAFPWLIVSVLGISNGYAEAVLVLSMLADAAFMVLLRCLGGRGRRAALTVWIAAVPLLGATAYARFDLVPGVLAGTALLLLVTRPRLAAAAAALAAGLKLWPALVLPALAVPPVSRSRVVGMTAVVGLALAAVSLALGGWGRLVSPFSWQAERGLQIESVAATPAMLARALSPAPYDIVYEHNAYEIAGPGTRDLLAASEVLALLALGGLASLWVLAFRRGRCVTGETVVWLVLAGVLACMVTSKVLSPQFLLWLLPLAAAALATTGSRELRVWTVVLLIATAATQLVFPVLYEHLLAPDEQTGWAGLALLVRNVLLVWLLVRASTLAVRGVMRAGVGRDEPAVSAGGRSSASRPVPQGRSAAASGGEPTTRT